MNSSTLKKLILSVISVCLLLGSFAVCYAEESIKAKLELEIPPTSKTQDTHISNTPQYGDNLQSIVTYDKAKITSEPVITWYRFNNKPLYDENNKKVQDTYYEKIHTGPSYLVAAEDIGHIIKVEAEINGETLVLETNPVEKKDYGEIKLKVVDNTNYGDTDGYIGYLDTRMQYTSDDITIFDVQEENTVLLSGSTSETLNPNGYSWKVRYRGTSLVQESDWYVFTIKPGYKTPLENADINLISRTLTPSDSEYQLKTTISPDNAYICSISYNSSDENVATVSADGLIHAVNNGTATITVNVIGSDTQFTKECEITVKNFDIISEAVIEEDSISLELENNESRQLTSSVLPETAKNYITSWRSSDESVCTVDSKGIVKAVSEGKAVITFSAKQDDVSVIDTVNVEVLPIPSVSSPEEWVSSCKKDLEFTFVGYTPDENTIVTITCENGRTEKIYKGNYKIDGNKIIISYEYLKYMPLGNATFSFEFPEDLEEKEDISGEKSEEKSQSSGEISPAAYTNTSKSFISKLKKAISYNMIELVADDDSGSENSNDSSVPSTPKIVMATVLFTDSSSLTLKPGNTICNCLVSGTGSFKVVIPSGAEDYFTIDQHLGDAEPYFRIISTGKNTPQGQTYTVKLEDGTSSIIGEWSVKAEGFIDFTNVTFSLDSTAEIKSDSKSTCIITPAFSDSSITIDSDFLDGYEISFIEVNSLGLEASTPYYFKQDSLKLNSSDFKLHAIANREGTGYIKGILSLKMTDGQITDSSKEIKRSSNSTKVSIELYEDVTSSNKQHLWSQNSYVNLTYTIQGDFARFLSEYGGTFSDNNVRLWYKKGTTYNPLTISNGQFYVQAVDESHVNIIISYNVLRRLYLGSYPLYISFKYDGSDYSLGPWNSSTWSKNGNYVLTMFTIIRAGIPIIGDAFKPAVWIGVAVFAISISAVIIYTLKRKKTAGRHSH